MGSVGEQRTCWRCKEAKPLEDFAISSNKAGGRDHSCKACKAADMQERRANTPAEVKADEMRAYRAGVRPGKCATCHTAIDGKGVCEPCRGALRQLGDSPEALRQAAKVLVWMHGRP